MTPMTRTVGEVPLSKWLMNRRMWTRLYGGVGFLLPINMTIDSHAHHHIG
jgi:hypothetical protein